MDKELQKIIKYLLVGVTNVIIDIGSFNLFLLVHTNPYLAASLSYTLSASNSFIHNRRWTFHDGHRNSLWVQYWQFMTANAIGYLFNIGLVYIFLRYIRIGNTTLNVNIAKLLAAGLIVVWNYTVSRYLIFRPLADKTNQ